MRFSKIVWTAAALCIALIVTLAITGIPGRVTPSDRVERADVKERLEQIEEKQAEVKEVVEEAASTEKENTTTPTAKEEKPVLPKDAPDSFKVKFECSNGEFVVECHKEWAPLGVQRFYELVNSGYYNDSSFFRVVPGFVVQFGLAGDPAVTAQWKDKRIKDDPVTESNVPGTLSFATSGPNTRTTQLFINTGNNARLDTMGFAPFAKVIQGETVVKSVNAEYGERPNQGLITAQGNAYVDKNFPNITKIVSTSVVQ